MKKLFTLFLITTAFNFSAKSQNVIAKWKFDTDSVQATPTATSPTFITGDAVADSGQQVIGSSFTGVHASVCTWSNPTGNGSSKSISSNTWAVGDYYQFSVNTTNYTGISLTYEQTGSNTGPSLFKLQYSTNGTTFTDFASYSIPTATANTALGWSAATYNVTSKISQDLSTITDLDNKSIVYFRLVVNGTTSINNSTVASGGTSRIDNFTVIASTLLPVTLKSISASLINNQPQVNWETSNETNFDYFGVEKSFDAKNFSEIARVASNKASNGSTYQYADINKTFATQFYRLKMVDNDGTFKYSSVVAVNAKPSISLALYPNPVTNTIILSHPKAIAGAAVKVTSIDGKILSTQNVQTGATQTSIDATRLVKGNYVVSFVNDGVSSTTQLVKQ